MARPERFELPTAWFVARYSIQLSYGRIEIRTEDYTENFPGVMCCWRRWRRERDSNPRWAINPYALSRGAPSATRPSLLNYQIVTILGPKYSETAVGITRPVGLAPSGPPSLRDDVVSRLRRSSRTLDGLLTHTPLAGARLQPLGHLS